MRINFNKVESYQPKLKVTTSGTTIGSIIKWQRKSQNLTLHEGSEGICSISYLSKVENNLIEPSPEILEGLKKRLDLGKIIDYDLRRFKEICKEIVVSFFYNKKLPELHYQLHKDNNDYKSKIVLFSYYVFYNQLSKASQMYRDIESELAKLSLDEMNLFFYLTANLLQKSGRYHEAYRFLMYVKHFETDKLLNLLVKTLQVELLLLLDSYINTFPLIEEVSNQLIEEEHYDRYIKFNFIVWKTLMKEYDYNIALQRNKDLKNYSKESKKYLTMLLNIYHERIEDNFVYLTNVYKSVDWYLLTLINYDYSENYQAIFNAINSKPEHIKGPLVEKLEFFLTTKYTNNHEAFLRYLRLENKNIYQSYNGLSILRILLNNSANYFEKKSFYKTANSIRKLKRSLSSSLKITLQ